MRVLRHWQTVPSYTELSKKIELLESRIDSLVDALDGLRRLVTLRHMTADRETQSASSVTEQPDVHTCPTLQVRVEADRERPTHGAANTAEQVAIVVITTETTTQPTRLCVHCTQPISRAEIVARGLVLAAAIPVRSDPRIVQVDVASPPFTPDVPLRVRLRARGPIGIRAVERVY